MAAAVHAQVQSALATVKVVKHTSRPRRPQERGGRRTATSTPPVAARPRVPTVPGAARGSPFSSRGRRRPSPRCPPRRHRPPRPPYAGPAPRRGGGTGPHVGRLLHAAGAGPRTAAVGPDPSRAGSGAAADTGRAQSPVPPDFRGGRAGARHRSPPATRQGHRASAALPPSLRGPCALRSRPRCAAPAALRACACSLRCAPPPCRTPLRGGAWVWACSRPRGPAPDRWRTWRSLLVYAHP